MKPIFLSFLIGYFFSWINHGKLVERIKHAHFYVTKRGYSLASAWYWAGRTL